MLQHFHPERIVPNSLHEHAALVVEKAATTARHVGLTIQASLQASHKTGRGELFPVLSCTSGTGNRMKRILI